MAISVIIIFFRIHVATADVGVVSLVAGNLCCSVYHHLSNYATCCLFHRYFHSKFESSLLESPNASAPQNGIGPGYVSKFVCILLAVLGIAIMSVSGE